MKILIRQARIIDTHSPFNGLIKDILVEKDQIIAIADHITDSADQIIESHNLEVSIGWVDTVKGVRIFSGKSGSLWRA
jgi:dihydroorotase